MNKTATFNCNDKELINRIEKYQKDNNFTFIGAVRDLCDCALKLKEIIK